LAKFILVVIIVYVVKQLVVKHVSNRSDCSVR